MARARPASLRGKLPRGWQRGLTAAQVAAVIRCERLADAGIVKIQPAVHEKGYLRVTLPPCHPYARSGTNLLHRYFFERAIGRRLREYEHIHHLPGTPPTCCDLRRLELWEAVEHGRIGVRVRRKLARMHRLWSPRDERGRFTRFPGPLTALLPVSDGEVPF